MSASAKKKELTTLEREAANMNYEDEETDVEVNNEEKYEAMLDARKERRAVSEHAHESVGFDRESAFTTSSSDR